MSKDFSEITKKLEKEEFSNYAKSITDNKKQREFIVNCLTEGQVTNKMIDDLFEKAKTYKQLLKNNNISIDNMIAESEGNQLYSKTFENINDEVEKSIILNQSKKLLRSVTSRKHAHLINKETQEIFFAMHQNGVTRQMLEDGVMKKVALFEDPQEFNDALISGYLNKMTKTELSRKIEKTNGKIISDKDGVVSIMVDDYESMEKLGTNMWCVQRSDKTYDSYTDTGSYFVITYDLNKKMSDPKSLIATIVKANGKVSEHYDNKDNFFTDEELSNRIEENSHSFTYEEFKERIKNLTSQGKTKKLLFAAAMSEGFLKNYEKEYAIDNPEEPTIWVDDYVRVYEEAIQRDMGSKDLKLIHEFNDKVKKEIIKSNLYDISSSNSNFPLKKTEALCYFLKDEKIKNIVHEEIKNNIENVDYRASNSFTALYLMARSGFQKNREHVNKFTNDMDYRNVLLAMRPNLSDFDNSLKVLDELKTLIPEKAQVESILKKEMRASVSERILNEQLLEGFSDEVIEHLKHDSIDLSLLSSLLMTSKKTVKFIEKVKLEDKKSERTFNDFLFKSYSNQTEVNYFGEVDNDLQEAMFIQMKKQIKDPLYLTSDELEYKMQNLFNNRYTEMQKQITPFIEKSYSVLSEEEKEVFNHNMTMKITMCAEASTRSMSTQKVTAEALDSLVKCTTPKIIENLESFIEKNKTKSIISDDLVIVRESHKSIDKAIRTWKLLYEDLEENQELTSKSKKNKI
ncbi:MAG: hypothetical protein CL760_11820 [Chloroflexi bacterium]|nr:hypothetical protein [Chloroflexota bacterium]|tara:strand:- start:67860 stop:70082 length:2223 start_codon:yes stop_codon:yes gene_type:complete